MSSCEDDKEGRAVNAPRQGQAWHLTAKLRARLPRTKKEMSRGPDNQRSLTLNNYIRCCGGHQLEQRMPVSVEKKAYTHRVHVVSAAGLTHLTAMAMPFLTLTVASSTVMFRAPYRRAYRLQLHDFSPNEQSCGRTTTCNPSYHRQSFWCSCTRVSKTLSISHLAHDVIIGTST